MLASLVAALACVISAPPNARVVDAGAMSLPLEAGPLSSPAAVAPDDAELWTPATEPRVSLAPRELLTPLDVECAGVTLTITDCSALSSRPDDRIGSCSVLAPGHGRLAVFARGRAHSSSQHVALGTIAAAPDLLTPDSHGSPMLWPARLGFTPSLVVSLVRAPPPGTAPMPPSRRLDRPPRS